MAALIDTRTARVVRSIGVAVLATVLVMVWMLPATSIIVQLALGALLACVIATTVVAFVRATNRTRQVPGFFWRQHGLSAAGSFAQLVVAGVCLVMMWMFPVELEISGSNIGGTIMEGDISSGDINFDPSVQFITLTVYVNFEYNPGETGHIVDMSRIAATQDDVTLRIKMY